MPRTSNPADPANPEEVEIVDQPVAPLPPVVSLPPDPGDVIVSIASHFTNVFVAYVDDEEYRVEGSLRVPAAVAEKLVEAALRSNVALNVVGLRSDTDNQEG